jgi:acetoin utilization deacetylase AcuC-like enzyme
MKIAKHICGNKIVSILEGGYNLTAVQESAKFHVEALLEVSAKQFVHSYI